MAGSAVETLRLVVVGEGAVDTYRKQEDLDGEPCLLEILDTACSAGEDYTAMRNLNIQNGQGFLCVYDITNRSSLDAITATYEHILQVKDVDEVPMIIVGNKCDLEEDRNVSEEEGKNLAKQCACPFYETSAKDKINVDIVFYDLAREVRRMNEHESGRGPCKKK